MYKSPLKEVIFALLILALLLAAPGSAETFTIISNPDPPPTGVVGYQYEVTFTTNVGYEMDRWVCSPENPVPGLSFSKMENVASVKLSGRPTKPGEFTFTLTVYYKGAPMGSRTLKIKIVSPPSTPRLDINRLQLSPAAVLLNRIYPQDIYVGQSVSFVFWTNHPDAESVVWSGIDALPGTSFRVVSVARFFQGLPPTLQNANELQPLRALSPNTPILLMEGAASTAGSFRVSVEARLGSTLERGVYTVSVLEPTIVLQMWLQPNNLLVDATRRAFEPLDTSYGSSYPGGGVNERRFTLTLEVEFRGYVGNITVGFRVSNPQGLTIEEQGTGKSLEDMTVSFSSDTPQRNTKYASIGCEVARLYNLPFLPWPGGQYRITITAEAEFMGRQVSTSETLTVNYFYYLPDLQISDLQPVSQLANPNHVLWQDAHEREYNVLVYGKQATFRFNYTLNFYFPVVVTFKLTLPKSQWEWNLTEVNEPGTRFIQKGGRRPALVPWEDYWSIVYYEEGSDAYIIYESLLLEPTSTPTTRILLAEKFLGRRGLWFPKPKSNTVSATLEVFSIGQLEGDELPVRIRLQGSFYSPVTTLGNLKLGFFIMDPGWFTSQWYRDLINNFPGNLTMYLEGGFPIKVKDVRFLGNVTMPAPANDSQAWVSSAQPWVEQVAEANLHRGVVIVPRGALSFLERGVVGVYFPGAPTLVFVDHSTTLDPPYQPCTAHELSHSFGYPDIYFGDKFPADLCWTCRYYGRNVTSPTQSPHKSCTGAPRVPGYYAYFDERRGGVIRYGDGASDIMACAGASWSHWIYHSWFTVYSGTTSLDPPKGLLISLLIFKNGTVIDRPFAILFNHSQAYPPTEGVGDVYLQLVSRSGEILRSYPFNLTFRMTSDPYLEFDLTSLVVTVEWSDRVGGVRLVDSRGGVLFSRLVTENAPEVEIEWPPPDLKLGLGRRYTFSWRGSDADGDRLLYNVHMRRLGEESWAILAHRVEETELTFGIPEGWEPGVYELMVKATDGVNTGYQLIRVEVVEKLPQYRVEVISNVGVEIPGSGVYEEGDRITLEAPSFVRMPGVLGLLGGRYVFQRWRGFMETTSNPISLVVAGGGDSIRIEAVYGEDYTLIYVVIAVVASSLVLLAALLKRRK